MSSVSQERVTRVPADAFDNLLGLTLTTPAAAVRTKLWQSRLTPEHGHLVQKDFDVGWHINHMAMLHFI